jgi:integrase
MSRSRRGDGTIYFDETKQRWIGAQWIDGRRRKVSAKTKTDAAVRLRNLARADAEELAADKTLTVAKLLENWRTMHLPNRELAPSTLDLHAWACNLWTKRLGRVKVADLEVFQIERALQAMSADGLSKASLKKIRSTLRQSLEWAMKRRAVAFNAAAMAELPTTAEPAGEKQALSADELRLLLKTAAGHRYAAMFYLMARCGLRPGEAAAIKPDALDLDGIPPAVSVVRGIRHSRSRPELVEELKTKASRRAVALPADVVDVLADHLAMVGLGDGDDGLLFTDAKGGPVHATTVRNELAALCSQAGVPVVLPNELRHTAATLMVDGGMAPHEVADALGHTSTRMVDVHYRHRPAVVRGPDLITLD